MLAERQRTRKSALCPWRSVVQKGEKIRVMNNEET
ncbi:hydrogenase, partial [Salmonella enterica subsp. enterica serovar Havana]